MTDSQQDLVTLLTASIAMAKLRKERDTARDEVKILRALLKVANLRSQRGLMLSKPQAG